MNKLTAGGDVRTLGVSLHAQPTISIPRQEWKLLGRKVGDGNFSYRLGGMTNFNPCMLKLEGHSDGVTSVCLNIDGSQLASGSRDKTILVWNVKTGVEKI